jgi:zinc transport system permease protein
MAILWLITKVILMDEFILYALLAGLGVTFIAGPLGSFILWRRMAFFGDTLAHTSLLGVALGLMLGIADLTIGVIVICVGAAAFLVLLQHRTRLGNDALLGILSHGTLAVGLVAVSFMDNVQLDLIGFLFGDILAVTLTDLAWIYGTTAISILVLLKIWQPLLSITIHEDLARAEGVKVTETNLLFMILIALVVAAAMKVVGILLIAALLIVPASAARHYAKTPEQMAAIAVVVGSISVIGGLGLSLGYDTPAGPSIVVIALVLFLMSALVPSVSRQS